MTTEYVRQPLAEPVEVRQDSPRYRHLMTRGKNRRFTARPEHIRVVTSTADVVRAVQDAVDGNRRLVVRSGGHCFEGFVDDPDVQVLVDTSLMDAVGFDPAYNAFMVESGARLGEVYRKLYLGHGVVVPAGESADVGAGGHVVGGGYGFLSRTHGLVIDHLYAVEVVVVDENGTASSVVATREPDDPHRELWWAHTGGGGGNFGVVTRYWFRSPGATGTHPGSLLPKAPDTVLRFDVTWSWDDLDEAAFSRLVRNFGAWCERNSDDEPGTAIFSALYLLPRDNGVISLSGTLADPGPDAERLIGEHLAALNDGVGAPCTRTDSLLPWLDFILHALDSEQDVDAMIAAGVKIKDAGFRGNVSDDQIATFHRYLTVPGHTYEYCVLGLETYGGKINAVAPDATAFAHRDLALRAWCVIGWADPADEERHLTWAREFYRDLFADTGGVPVVRGAVGGSYINHPDVDLADPRWNTSGVPWHTLYYRDNYPRLQRVKRRWDPRDVFRHALSVEPS